MHPALAAFVRPCTSHPAALEQAQHARCHHALHRGNVRFTKRTRWVKAQRTVALAENPVDDGAMIMGMCVKPSAPVAPRTPRPTLSSFSSCCSHTRNGSNLSIPRARRCGPWSNSSNNAVSRPTTKPVLPIASPTRSNSTFLNPFNGLRTRTPASSATFSAVGPRSRPSSSHAAQPSSASSANITCTIATSSSGASSPSRKPHR